MLVLQCKKGCEKDMLLFEFDVSRPVEYALTGKFEAPTPSWQHQLAPLIEYELFVVTKDTLYISYAGEQFEVSEGEFLILPPTPPPTNFRKGFRASDCSFYWLHFSAAGNPNYVEVPDLTHESYPYPVPKYTLSIPRHASVPIPDKIIVMMKQLQDAVRSNYDITTLNYITTAVLCELHSQFYRDNALNVQAKRSHKQMYHDIIDYVKLNTHRNLKVSDVAAHFGYNEKYLSHLFSNIAGLPLKQFILNVKMDAANFMLTDSNASIGEIATALGFSDSHNFAKAYKKIAGLTPTEYRNAFSKRLLYHV